MSKLMKYFPFLIASMGSSKEYLLYWIEIFIETHNYAMVFQYLEVTNANEEKLVNKDSPISS